MKIQRPRKPNNLKKKKLKDSHLSISKPTFKSKVIKTMWYCHKGRNTDQWNGTESLEVTP